MSTGMRLNSWDTTFRDVPPALVDAAKFALACLLSDQGFMERCDRFRAWCQSGQAPADGKGLSQRGLRAA